MPRILFEKKGNAVWISHLDLMRLFQRAFKRAGLPLTHTQGFNPRPSVSIALPLSVGVESNCDDIYPLSILNNALGGGMSSRLFQRIREELGMAYSVYTYASSYRGVGSFNIYAGTNPENGEIVLREIQEQLKLFLENGMTEKEFKSAKAQLRGGYVLGLESSSGRMQSLGRGMLLFGKTRTPEETIAKIDAVTMDSVMALANRILCAQPSAAIVGRDAEKYLSTIGGGLNG